MSFDLEELSFALAKDENSEQFKLRVFNYAKYLNDNGLPVIFSTKHLKLELALKQDEIYSILSDSSNFYKYFRLKKRRSVLKEDFREIMAPTQNLKYIQKWIHINILLKLKLPEACLGFRPGLSILDNAKVHANAYEFLKIDLLRFFDTITEKRVFGFFQSIGYKSNLAYDLAKITTAKHRESYWHSVEKRGFKELKPLYTYMPATLPQGAPTSPMLANHIASKMDYRLMKLAKITGSNYSRYADDLTFSVTLENGKIPSKELIFKIIQEEGFFINKDKVNYFKRGMKQYVTGLTVTHGVHVSKRFRKEIFKHIFFAKKYGPNNHMEKWSHDQKVKTPYNFQDWLMGNISFIYSIDKATGIKMLEEYKKIDWSF